MSTVLVVDDNPANLKLAQLVLEKAGHQVITAGDGEAGLRLARERLPALVVMDVQMPGLDGLAATRALRADAATAGIKVLALSALAMKGDAERILESGCDAYLAKPFHYQDLIDTAARLLR
ncbi:MAG TPA: response regulator [Methylibium sp.]|uniref:response regulator n=1 Tax=Methylibium sp. TaxID=2067992 RepID=UPI002DBD5A34|nr:response regulator [Methylibium sp.]HEU4459450.1 response regulator [Methylibium sp.]